MWEAIRKAYQNCVAVSSVKVEKKTSSKYFVNADNHQLTRDYEDKEVLIILILSFILLEQRVLVSLKLISFTIIRPTEIAKKAK